MEGRGKVYIAPLDPVPTDGSMVSPVSRFHGMWEGDDEEFIEDAGFFASAEEAIAWGRERARTVLIRLGNRGDTYFSAGEKLADDDEGSLPQWPPTEPD